MDLDSKTYSQLYESLSQILIEMEQNNVRGAKSLLEDLTSKVYYANVK